MRKWVDKYLSESAISNNNIKLIIADVGDFPLFSERHPGSFINAGVSESNAIGVAAGLASVGYDVYIYCVSSFFLYRAYEQLKYSISYWNQNITLIGVGFGWKYYNIGIGHFCPDDIKLVQGLPNFEIHTPYTLEQLHNLLSKSSHNPRYIRLTANIVQDNCLGITNQHRLVVASYGEMIKTCLSAIESLKAQGYDIGLLPFDTINASEVKKKTDGKRHLKYVVIEDQCELGGLYPIFKSLDINVVGRIGLPLLPNKVSLTRHDLLKEYKLDRDSIIKRIINIANHG